MANPELLGQIKQFAASGQGSESTKNILVASGWKKAEVEEAINELGGEEFFSNQQKAVAAILKPRVVDVQIKKSRWKLWFLATVGAVVILAGAVYAFYLYPRSKSLGVILNSAINNLVEARSFRYDAKGKINFNISDVSSSLKFFGLGLGKIINGKGSSSTLTFDAGGYSSIPLDGQPKISMEVNAKALGDKLPEISASGEVLLMGEAVYFKVTQVGGGFGFVDGTQVMEQWVENEIPKESNVLPVTVDQWKVFNKLLRDNQFLMVKEKLADESIDGVPAYHFRLDIDQKVFQEFLKGWLGSVLSDNPESTNEVLPANGKINAWTKEFKDMNFAGDIELWVEKSRNIPTRTLINVNIKDKNETGSISLNWDTLYSKFNEAAPDFKDPINIKSEADWDKDLLRVLDDRRVLNLKAVKVLVGRYYKKCGFYPGPENCAGGFKTEPESWGKLIEVLRKSGFIDEKFKTDFDSDSIYQYGSDGSHYLMGVTLSDVLHPALRNGLRGSALGVSCVYLVFCTASFINN